MVTEIKNRILENSIYSKDNSKKFGEVFTSFKLINEMVDSLPKEIWKDKSKTFFDPTAGKGNFVIILIERLLIGLKDQFETEELCYKHIIENMIYQAEYQKESAKFIFDNFSFNNRYKINLYVGDSLSIPEDFFDLSFEDRYIKYKEHIID